MEDQVRVQEAAAKWHTYLCMHTNVCWYKSQVRCHMFNSTEVENVELVIKPQVKLLNMHETQRS